MHIIKVKITGPYVPSEKFYEFAEYFFDGLYKSKQIINEEYLYEPIEGGLSLLIYCPEVFSIEPQNATMYTKKWKVKLEQELNSNFEFKYLGTNLQYGKYSIPEKSNFYILNYRGFSPIIDGDSKESIPYYKIPYTNHNKDCYDDLNSWERNYRRVIGLWHNGLDDKWTLKQLQNFDSELNKEGISCSKRIEELTGVPTYYFLFNDRNWSLKKDLNWKCPSCGGNWIIPGKTYHDWYAFKCDACRLISELSPNIKEFSGK